MMCRKRNRSDGGGAFAGEEYEGKPNPPLRWLEGWMKASARRPSKTLFERWDERWKEEQGWRAIGRDGSA